jgi:hypothetical protein
MIRSRRAGWRTQYQVQRDHLMYLRGGLDVDQFDFNGSTSDDRLLLQGEFWDDHTRYLMCSRSRRSMKEAMRLDVFCATDQATGKPLYAPYFVKVHAEGIRSIVLLKRAVNANSWDDFQVLIEQYPDHVIAFSCYDCCLGTVPLRNTIIWECRAYCVSVQTRTSWRRLQHPFDRGGAATMSSVIGSVVALYTFER